MDKKKLIKWITGIIANLAALVAIYLHEQPAVSDAQATADSIAAATASPLNFSNVEAPENTAGLLTRVAAEVQSDLLTDEARRRARARTFLRSDTLLNVAKQPLHVRQQLWFEEKAAEAQLSRDTKALLAKKNGAEAVPKELTASDWDSLNHITSKVRLWGEYFLRPDVQVYGFHPYWMGTAWRSYNFSLLSTVAYYGAEINAQTGDITTTHGWQNSGIFNAAGTMGCAIELAVVNTGSSDNIDFLCDSISQENLIYQLTELLLVRGDGVCLDFQGIPTSQRDNFTRFVNLLHATLTDSVMKSRADYSLTVVLPAVDWLQAYDVKALSPLVTRFVMTGYDYYGAFSNTAGPIAPLRSGLTWRAPNLERSVDTWLAAGIPPPQLVLALPNYGVAWQTVTNRKNAAEVEFRGFMLYRDLREQLAIKPVRYDSTSITAVYASATTLPMQFWFDNQQTLGEKYRWALHRKLGGIGIWALGYDNGSTDLWHLLRNTVARDQLSQDTTYVTRFPTLVQDTTLLQPDNEWGIVSGNGHYLIFDNPWAVLCTLLVLFAVFLLAQVILDQHPWNELFSRRVLLYVLVSFTGTVGLLLIGLALWSRLPHREIYLLLGALISGYLLFRITQRISGKKEKLP